MGILWGKERETMSIGLSKEELERLFSFGKTPEEQELNLFGSDKGNFIKLLTHERKALQTKYIELILANNERINEQLKRQGLNLD
jgi:hypothetical protein